uniref:Uncharacterized protein n=1 Tax=Anguilla anguilla TaxID=7936 RepID=A0A0E9SYN2_ANGAN
MRASIFLPFTLLVHQLICPPDCCSRSGT